MRKPRGARTAALRTHESGSNLRWRALDHSAGPKITSKGQARPAVCRVASRLDVTTAPPNARGGLKARRPPALAVQDRIVRAALLSGEELPHVVA